MFSKRGDSLLEAEKESYPSPIPPPGGGGGGGERGGGGRNNAPNPYKRWKIGTRATVAYLMYCAGTPVPCAHGNVAMTITKKNTRERM